MTYSIEGKKISVSGKVFRSGRLRHEWCDFLEDGPAAIRTMQQGRSSCDLFTFVYELSDSDRECPYHKETASAAVLSIKSYDDWWDGIGFKARNKIKKGLKSGVTLRPAELDETFARGVQAIYDETPVRQGRKFYHYGKSAAEIKMELQSFHDRCILIGAYYQDELVGFMKLFKGKNVLRTVHIIAKISHRDKVIMDTLIAQAVKLCDENKAEHLHYGSWTDGGIGTFREKHGFRQVDHPRYYVPLSARGRMMLGLKLHQPLKSRLPTSWIDPIARIRSRWNTIRFSGASATARQ